MLRDTWYEIGGILREIVGSGGIYNYIKDLNDDMRFPGENFYVQLRHMDRCFENCVRHMVCDR